MKKKIWGAYGFLCAVLLLMAASSFLRKRVTYEMGVNLHVTEGEVKEATLGKPLALSRGVYEVTVEYQAEGTENTIFAKSDTRPGKVGSDAILLERGKTEESFQVWVSADVPDVTIRTAYQGYNGFSVSKVTVKESIQGRRRELAQAVLFRQSLNYLPRKHSDKISGQLKRHLRLRQVRRRVGKQKAHHRAYHNQTEYPPYDELPFLRARHEPAEIIFHKLFLFSFVFSLKRTS